MTSSILAGGACRNDCYSPLSKVPGYQGSKAAMKLMAQADVVVALGSRLGPLPQHGMDYWPKDARIIQIDADHTMLGLVKKISVGICGAAKAAAIALTQRLTNRTLACDGTRAERAAKIKDEKAVTPCTRARYCANSKRPCRPTSWCL